MNNTADYMWRCHGCFEENVLDHCPSCFNCAHIRCGYCEVYLNPVKNAYTPVHAPAPVPTLMWTCCRCSSDNRSSAGGVCWNCDHYRDGNCRQHLVYPQD
ncbi:hypothetical protein CEP54_008474 [Fusarium duplospermum]|uniref:Uncharacterized protein n=1 Tax=Fusarium duplospermum TaxID=1325734 RepID=A0A428PVN6_9HYPO|nr:hypothetical protein CEP54_008474 [Fusarium duplospermum]